MSLNRGPTRAGSTRYMDSTFKFNTDNGAKNAFTTGDCIDHTWKPMFVQSDPDLVTSSGERLLLIQKSPVPIGGVRPQSDPSAPAQNSNIRFLYPRYGSLTKSSSEGVEYQPVGGLFKYHTGTKWETHTVEPKCTDYSFAGKHEPIRTRYLGHVKLVISANQGLVFPDSVGSAVIREPTESGNLLVPDWLITSFT
eukprot:sb/3470914/